MHYQDVLKFWFEETPTQFWFVKDTGFDQTVTERFLKTYEAAKIGALDEWKNSPEGMVALIIVLDQFPRNMFRGEGTSFATDNLAVSLTKEAMKLGYDKQLKDQYKKFLFMPLMHSENLEDQELGIQEFAFDPMSQDYAVKHRDIIVKFNRFPHRNEALGRESTPEEIEFLKTHGGF